jgi:hypothetical protein
MSVKLFTILDIALFLGSFAYSLHRAWVLRRTDSYDKAMPDKTEVPKASRPDQTFRPERKSRTEQIR